MTPEEALAREEIRAVLAAYTVPGDRGHIDEMVNAFADDAVLELADGTHYGRAAIRAQLGRVGGSGPTADETGGRFFLRHHLTSSHITFDGPATAGGRTYFLVMTPRGVDHCGVYTDRFVVDDGRWAIAHRRVRLDWVASDSWFADAVAGSGAPG